jgi:hypothetical protein
VLHRVVPGRDGCNEGFESDLIDKIKVSVGEGIWVGNDLLRMENHI